MELNEILKSARVPERAGEYWEQFPGAVMAEMRRREQRANVERRTDVRVRRAGLGSFAQVLKSALRIGRVPALGTGLAVICIILGFAAGFWKGSHSAAGGQAELAEAQKCFREITALFPNQIRGIVLDRLGARLVLAEQANVPASPPLYLRICGPNGCQRFVTFSGQQIQVNGDNFDVLVDRQGDVLVVGTQWVWSSSEPAGNVGGYRIEARPLPTES